MDCRHLSNITMFFYKNTDFDPTMIFLTFKINYLLFLSPTHAHEI
jgi:hypothetical protein